MTTIDALVALVPPPRNPIDASGDWTQVENALGLELPSDFRSLIGSYGLGQFVNFITPLTPFGSRNLLLQSAQLLLESEQPFREANPDKCPYPYYPEAGGLLEWAGTDNGDRLCWATGGHPDTWTVSSCARPVNDLVSVRSVDVESKCLVRPLHLAGLAAAA